MFFPEYLDLVRPLISQAKSLHRQLSSRLQGTCYTCPWDYAVHELNVSRAVVDELEFIQTLWKVVSLIAIIDQWDIGNPANNDELYHLLNQSLVQAWNKLPDMELNHMVSYSMKLLTEIEAAC